MTQVLLVDDEPSLREMTQMMLRREGYEVTAADSGETALELLEAAGEFSYDLVLTDLKMTGLTGLDAA